MPETPDAPSQKSGRERQVLSTLYHISSLVGQVDAPDEAMARIIDALASLFSADSAALALINPDTNALEIECSRNFPEEHRRAVIPPGVGLMGWCALQNRPVVVAEVAHEPRHLPLRSATRAMMAAPLDVDGQLHGVIALESDRPGVYGQADLQTFVLLTGEAARVLRRLWLIEALRRKASQLEVLGNIAQELSGKLQPEELMDTVTRESHRLTHCRVATLQLFDPAKRRVRLQAIYPPGNHFSPGSTEWLLEDCLAGSAISTRRQVEFSNLHQPEYRDLQDIPGGVHLVSMLSTPLISDNEVAGVLCVYTDRPHRFANDERRLLKTLANLAAVALQNARLYQRVFQGEENLRSSERLTTLGMLAAEIAHETRNPLTVIRLLFGALDLKFPDEDPRATDVTIIREKLDQLESFVTRVLTFAKAPESLHSRWNLDDIIRETCLLLRLKLNQARIHMHYEPPALPTAVDCNKGQIQQVLLNVILNATHAMPEGGSVTIGCKTQPASGHDMVYVDIHDTGHGIAVEFRDRIFDSFLSTRTDGTGLGLAIAKRIMRSHHGDIEVAASSPKGTTMRLSIPVAK